MRRLSLADNDTVGVVYLARGADDGCLQKLGRFVASYRLSQAGIAHQLFVIFKGFANAHDLAMARDIIHGIEYKPIYVDDRGFDLGAYFVAASRVDCRILCFLNTASEISGEDWLLKLAINHALPGVGLVGCTGSFEAPRQRGMGGIAFPNPHVRTNAFMIRRDRFLATCPSEFPVDKHEAYLIEHGPQSITRRVAADGLKTLVVGKDGRGYEPIWWPRSRTFRQGLQENLLVTDNQTRQFQNAPVAEKQFLFRLCWGDGLIFNVFEDARFGHPASRQGASAKDLLAPKTYRPSATSELGSIRGPGERSASVPVSGC